MVGGDVNPKPTRTQFNMKQNRGRENLQILIAKKPHNFPFGTEELLQQLIDYQNNWLLPGLINNPLEKTHNYKHGRLNVISVSLSELLLMGEWERWTPSPPPQSNLLWEEEEEEECQMNVMLRDSDTLPSAEELALLSG